MLAPPSCVERSAAAAPRSASREAGRGAGAAPRPLGCVSAAGTLRPLPGAQTYAGERCPLVTRVGDAARPELGRALRRLVLAKVQALAHPLQKVV